MGSVVPHARAFSGQANHNNNSANQRTRRVEADGSDWRFNYDPLGQVTSGRKYWPDFTPVSGQQFEYSFDDIGNRLSTKAGGDENGLNLRPANYSVNSLNQYTSREVPGAFDVIGLELATNTVKVNGDVAYRKGEYFRKEVTVANLSNPVWQSVSVTATNETTVTGGVFVPKRTEQFFYDPDGNLTNDGRWYYTWDAENRLIRMATNTTVGPQISLTFDYDSKSRRIRKQVWYGGSATNDLRFVYDGWNLVAIVNSQSSILQSFLWGLDLSGSPQGAGGVGGLLAVNDTAAGIHFAAFDGNGNVAALVKASDGTTSAQYEYGPFGEIMRATYANPLVRQKLGAGGFRFSTKYQDAETDLLYYGYRYYSGSTGRWLARDPLGEKAGINLTAFAKNDLENYFDPLGHSTYSRTDPRPMCCPDLFTKTCAEICRMALRNLELNRSLIGGGVVCYNGKACGCIAGDPISGWAPGDCPLIDEIIMAHENHHAANVICHRCGLYHAEESDLIDLDLRKEECEQRKITVQSLYGILLILPDGRCRDVAQGIIAILEHWHPTEGRRRA